MSGPAVFSTAGAASAAAAAGAAASSASHGGAGSSSSGAAESKSGVPFYGSRAAAVAPFTPGVFDASLAARQRQLADLAASVRGGSGSQAPGKANATASFASAFSRSRMVHEGAKMALVGLIGGTLYGLARGAASDRGVLFELDPPTEAFDLDPTLAKLFHKLAKYRHLQPASYIAAVRKADQLLLLKRTISASKRATDGDYTMGETNIQACLAHVMMLRNRAPDGASRAELDILKQTINDCLCDHRLELRHLCATTRT